MFVSAPAYYDSNSKYARTTKAAPAAITTPAGEKQPGVVIFSRGTIYGVLATSEALRLANEIADAIERVEKAHA